MTRPKRDRQKAWCVMRAYESFTVKDLVSVAQAPPTIRRYVWLLRKHGYLSLEGKNLYRLVRDTGAVAPFELDHRLVDPNLAGMVLDPSQRVWNAISKVQSWGISQLADLAETTYALAYRYSQCLTAKEYAVCVAKGARIRGQHDLYQLTRRTGPVAPLFLQNGEHFDANLFSQEIRRKV